MKFTRLVAITMGTPLASSVFLSIIIMVLLVGSLINLVLAVLISTVIVVLVSFAYGELVSIYPSAAGNRIFLKKPIGNTLALSLSVMWIIAILGAAGTEAYMAGNVLHYLVGSIPPIFWAILILTLVVFINILGVEISGNFQMIITLFVVISLILVSIYSIFFVKSVQPVAMGQINWFSIFSASAVSVYFFLGFGRVTTLGEEAIDFKKGIPRAMPLGIVLIGVTFILASIAIFERVPLDVLRTTVIPQIVLGKYILAGTQLPILIGIISIVMSFSAFNAGILGTSRLVYALGREGTFPKFLGKIQTRFLTPYVSLLFLYVIVLFITVVVFVTGNYSVIVLVAAAFDSFMYGLVGYAALWHHRKLKREEIPFYVKGAIPFFLIAITVFILFGILLLITSSVYVAIIVILGTVFLTIFYWALYKSGRLGKR
ncbi:MAG: APC family permease [Candidatus Thermoplasmatota archaeon]|nr:APC family permease [Candidatus Thermoplasmatota archaeon]